MLIPVIQMLVLAHEVDDVRKAIGHGARILSAYESLTLFERQDDGTLVATLHDGADVPPAAQGLERMLAEKAAKSDRTMRTLDRVVDEREQGRLDEYTDSERLAIARPLRAYGELVGAVVLHNHNQRVLDESELDNLRRFCEFAAAALSSARIRADLDAYAYTDALTGLANRRRLEKELEAAAGSPVALLLVDFDGLKMVNDQLSYDDGDRLIAAIGSALNALARPGELIVRYGGDEFVVLIGGADTVQARRRADEVTDVLDRIALPDRIATWFHGASVGWAAVAPDERPANALSRAAAEMRSRKRRRKTDRELGSAGPHDAAAAG